MGIGADGFDKLSQRLGSTPPDLTQGFDKLSQRSG